MKARYIVSLIVIILAVVYMFACNPSTATKTNSSEAKGKEPQGGNQTADPAKTSSGSKEAGDVQHIIGEDQFTNEVLNYEGVVLVDFTAGWCQPCRMLSPHIIKLASEMKGRLKVVKVYEDEKGKPNMGLLRKYKIGAYPTLMIFKSGDAAASRMGYIDYGMLKNWVEQNI